MKDSEGLKSALCLLLSCSLSINHCLTNPFLAKQPPPHPKALPVWHRVTPTMLRLKSDFPSLAHSEQRAEQRSACREMLHLPFHSEYTQGAPSRHAASTSHTSNAEDWLAAVVTAGRQAR